MFCEKCGASIPNGAKFCEKCGTPVSVPGAGAHGPTPGPNPDPTPGPNPGPLPGPKKPNPALETLGKAKTFLGEFFKNKRNLYITIGAGAALLIGIIVIIIIAAQPKTITIDDYFTVTIEGTDGFGRAKVTWDETKLAEISREVAKRGSSNAKKEMDDAMGQLGDLGGMLGGLGDGLNSLYESAFRLNYFVNITLEPSTGLKNGDKVTVKATCPDGFEDSYDMKIKLNKTTVEVKDLPGVSAYDALKNVTLSYEGYDGYGRAKLQAPETKSEAFGTVRYSTYENSVEFRVEGEEGNSPYITYSFTIPENLKNGDKITASLNGGSSLDETLASSFGITISKKSAEYTVEGLAKIESFDPSGLVTVTGEGYSGHARVVLEAAKKDAKVGDKTLHPVIEQSWSDRYSLLLEIRAGGQTVASINYGAEIEDNGSLKNGDIVRFTADEDTVQRIVHECGIRLPTEFEHKVDGLKSATAADPLTAVTINFTGFDGYGSATPSLSSSTMKAGDYTLKLTLSEEREFPLTVVVAKGDENLFSVVYRLSSGNSLKNGDEVKYSYSNCTGVKNLKDILDTYGLDFSEEKSYIVSSLTAPTSVDLRDYLTYSFTPEENNKIALSMSLKQTVYTAGSYTVTMEIVNERDWGTDYVREKFTITDAAGTVAASGCYETRASGYAEGDAAKIRAEFDAKEIVAATGLLLSTEEKQIIVSTR